MHYHKLIEFRQILKKSGFHYNNLYFIKIETIFSSHKNDLIEFLIDSFDHGGAYLNIDYFSTNLNTFNFIKVPRKRNLLVITLIKKKQIFDK